MQLADALYFFLPALLIGYWVKRPAYLGPLDPLQLTAVSEAVWVATVHGLYQQSVASLDQVGIFAATFLLWWLAWYAFSRRYGSAYRRAMTRFFFRVAEMRPRNRRVLTTLVLLVGTIVFAVSQFGGGGGDNRLGVMKLLRPLEGATTILPPTLLFVLMLAKGKWPKFLFVLLLVELIGFGGKSAILQVLLPLTGAMLIGRIKVGPRFFGALGGVLVVGYLVSVYVNYGTTSLSDALNLLLLRVSLDGDVYLLGLPNDVLSRVDTNSLPLYLLGPYLKALFLPVSIDGNIGAQIGSILSGEDSANGPNPHWPIVLMAYQAGIVVALLLSVLLYAVVLLLKFRLTSSRFFLSAPMWLLVPLGGFCLQFPQTFFADPTFPSIYLVHAVFMALVLRLTFSTGRRRAPIAHDHHRLA